jgi:hypothetical protein
MHGATTAELDRLSIQTAAEMTGEEPQYSRLAARLLAAYIGKEVRGQGIASFSQAIALGQAEGLVSDQTAGFVKDNARKLDDAIELAGDLGFEHVADRRLAQLGIEELYGSKNPFAFMDLQDVQELSNFFERRVSAYQVGVTGTVAFDHDF